MGFFFQGLTLGLAYIAPIGMQNLFVIDSALTKPRRRALLTALIVLFFDVSLSLSCFFGIGKLMQDRGKHLAGTAPGCRKIQNGHALCFGLGKIIIADFGNHKKVPSFNYDCKAACSAAVCRTWLWRIYTIVWAGRGKDIPLLLIVHSLGCFVNKKKTES